MGQGQTVVLEGLPDREAVLRLAAQRHHADAAQVGAVGEQCPVPQFEVVAAAVGDAGGELVVVVDRARQSAGEVAPDSLRWPASGPRR